MFHFVRFHSQAYVCAGHIQRVREHEVKPMFTDAHSYDLIVPTFRTRSAVTLTNGMELFSSRPCQDLTSAIAEANQQVRAVPMMPVVISDRITVDPAYIVAILPYDPQICEFVEEHGYEIYIACKGPQSLIVTKGETCLAVETTPAELLDKLNAQQA